MPALESRQDETLYIALKKHFKELINSGELAPGEKLPGERAIAAKYSVSRWTVVEALKLLERENYIKRIDRRGAFVNDLSTEKSRLLNIFYALPDDPVNEENLGFSGWQRHHEIQTGLMAGMRQFGLNLQFIDPSRYALETAEEMFTGADGVIFWDFVSEMLVRRLTNRGVNCVIMVPKNTISGFSSVSYDREKGIKMVSDFIIERKYKSVGFLVSSSLAERAARIKMNLEVSGVKTAPEWIYQLGACSINEGYEILRLSLDRDLNALPELLYCDQMIYPIPLLRLIYERGWELGKDIKVMSYTCRNAISNISSDLTYVRIPYFEMGLEACKLIRKLHDDNDGEIRHIKIQPELVRSISA
ncbi:MAG: GntR family transcriptional regulator [Victivallales bacterium]